MRSAAALRAPDLARLPIVINARAVSLAEGMRAGLSVAALTVLGEYLHVPPLREAALAALLTCICDPGGPFRRRLPVLISFALLGAAVTAGFGLLRNFGPAVALPVGLFGLFCSSFARIFGQAPQQLGALLAVVQILSLDRGNPSLTEAGILAAAFIGGALWAILLTMVIWRIYPFLPARRAVAEAYRQASELVRDLHNLLKARSVSDAAWEAHARIHRRATREAIETARTIVMDTLRSRGVASNRAAQVVIRLETIEQIFGGLIGLSDLLEHASQAEREVAEQLLRRMRPVILMLGRIIVTDDAEAHLRIGRTLNAMTADVQVVPKYSPLRSMCDLIIERLRIALTLAAPANLTPGADATGRPGPLWQRVTRPLRANLTWQSPALRHALRSATTAAFPLAFTMFWFTPYDHWLTITVVATMQPYFSLTYTRAIERILGTALGGVIAAAVGLVCTTPIAMAAAMFLLSMGAFAVRTVSFGLFMMAMTPLVVLLVETGSPETHEWLIAAARAALTTIGGVVAVGANFLLWPSREPDLVAAEVRNAIAAHGTYADANFAVLQGELTAAQLDHVRRAAGLASNTLEALITRALLEPGKRHYASLEAAMAIDAALRRCAGRLATLQHDPALLEHMPGEQLTLWRNWIATSLRQLGTGDDAIPPRPGDVENDALARIARQIELISGASRRLA